MSALGSAEEHASLHRSTALTYCLNMGDLVLCFLTISHVDRVLRRYVCECLCCCTQERVVVAFSPRKNAFVVRTDRVCGSNCGRSAVSLTLL